MKKKWIFACFALAAAFSSCKKDDKEPILVDASVGAYIVNEGSFLSNNASLIYIDPDGQVTTDVYYLANEVELGDVLQSFTIKDGRGYAVLNNSQKIEVVEMSTMINKGTISGLSYPRYAAGVGSNKLYVTNGSFQGTVEVFNTETLSNEGSISVGYGPNQLLLHNNELWVCNQGGWGIDSTISVINTATNLVVDVITLAHRPEDLIVDAFGDIWILCAGETFYDESWNVSGHSPAKLFRIDGNSHAIENSFIIGELGDHPRQLEVSPNGRTLYYENNGVFAVDVNSAELPGAILIASAKSALSVHPSTGDVWCASISDYIYPSTVYVYATDGALLRSYEGGIGTNAVKFN